MPRPRRLPTRPLDAAGQRLIERNLALVYRFAGDNFERVRRYVEFDDFVADLQLALIDRVPAFNPARGKFSTFAYPIMKSRTLLYWHGRQTDRRKVADITTHAGEHTLNFAGRDLAEPELVDVKDDLHSRWHVLSDRDREVLYGLFWRGMTLQQVGLLIGVSDERVRQIKENAIGKLRAA